MWLCECECGKTSVVRGANLTKGHTQSCGCFNLVIKPKHGHTVDHYKTPEYRAWTDAKQRCYNQNNKAFKDYGNRGITVCDEWLNNFQAFIDYMGPKPSPDHTLDRFTVRRYFRQIVTVEDVQRPKPDPDGLLRILDGTDPDRTLYLGDNVDDALAAKRARVPFLGVLSRGSAVHRLRVHRLRELGARAILGTITELEKHLR